MELSRHLDINVKSPKQRFTRNSNGTPLTESIERRSFAFFAEKGMVEIDSRNVTLNSLSTLYHYFGIAIDTDSIIHKYSLDSKTLDEVILSKIFRDSGVRCRVVSKRGKLEGLPMPCLAKNKDGSWFILAKAGGGKYLVQNVTAGANSTLAEAELKEVYGGKVIVLKPKAGERQAVEFGLKWFIPFVLKYKSQFIQVLIAVFTIHILGLFSPIIMQVIIDKVLSHNSLNTLNVVMFILVVITVFEFMMGIAKNYVFTSATNKIDVLLGSKLFEHLLRLPLAYFESRRVGDTVARIRELESIRRFLTGTPLTTILDLGFIFVYLGVMYIYSPGLTAVVVWTLPVFAAVSLLFTPVLRKRLDEKFTAGAENQAFMVETISGISTIKSMALEPKFYDGWNETLAAFVRTGYKSSILSGNLNGVISLIQKSSGLIVLWLGVTYVMGGRLTVGQLIAFRMLSGGVTGPILRVVQLWQEIQQGSISIKRVSDIFNAKPEVGFTEQKTKLPRIEGRIRFEGVSFRYKPDEPEILRNMSFEIPSGRVVGIVGRSGSGKSTIAKLIQRLYVPERGKILIDNTDISIVDSEWLRSQIGIVMQESFLFSRTIRENIAINMPSASIEDIVRAASIAGAHEFILALPNGYDTQLGENGVGLSGGQKQRIAIARALLLNPKILIFDEATSALDYESENIIHQNMNEICKGRTTILIAHRLSSLKRADAIMTIEKGQLMEYAPEELLLKNNGLYAYLYNQQFGGIKE